MLWLSGDHLICTSQPYQHLLSKKINTQEAALATLPLTVPSYKASTIAMLCTTTKLLHCFFLFLLQKGLYRHVYATFGRSEMGVVCSCCPTSHYVELLLKHCINAVAMAVYKHSTAYPFLEKGVDTITCIQPWTPVK